MSLERARERYQLKIELLDPDQDPRMWQSLVLPQFLITPKGVLWRQRKPHRYGPITPRERRVTVVERSTGDVVLTFVAPAGEDAQEIVAALQHDYMRDTADEWRNAWLVDLTSALGSG